MQFSEVVEYAQRLQTQYGKRCQDHPWGCVELSPEEPHLELTIKMYMDWAGLVVRSFVTFETNMSSSAVPRTVFLLTSCSPPHPFVLLGEWAVDDG